MLVLDCSNVQGKIFVETKNLDGETNLKPKSIPQTLSKFKNRYCKAYYSLVDNMLDPNKSHLPSTISKSIPFEVDKYLNKLKKRNLQVYFEAPNEHLYKFQGSLQLEFPGELESPVRTSPVEEQNVLLRGSILRNTDYVFGLILYTGHDTKIMKNSVPARVKRSKLEQQLNLYLQLIFVFLIVFCMTGSTFYILWIKQNLEKVKYMEIPSRLTSTFFTRLGNWLLIFANMIPISLMVSLESVKFMQAKIISSDPSLVTKASNIKCEVQSSNLNEELGQIDFIFSDKTGTLTCNQMNFKKLVIGNKPNGNFPEKSLIDAKIAGSYFFIICFIIFDYYFFVAFSKKR